MDTDTGTADPPGSEDPLAAVATEPDRSSGTVLVFEPSAFLTVTIEGEGEDTSEIHLHGGGQGYWVARMAATLGATVRLCGMFGGEPGDILVGNARREGLSPVVVPMVTANGVRLYDRRSGERELVTETVPPPLSRHEVDDLYNAVLAEALHADVLVLTGPAWPELLPADVYGRLAADVGAIGGTVVADLAADALTAAVGGGLAVLKISHSELIDDGRAKSDQVRSLAAAMRRLVDEGAAAVVVSRADAGALVLVDDELLEFTAPELTVVDHHGAGDSMTAAIATALAGGVDVRGAVRLGLAAGAVNTTRRGLATGHPDAIARFVDLVEVREVGTGAAAGRKRR